jgi:hypothetical protein
MKKLIFLTFVIFSLFLCIREAFCVSFIVSVTPNSREAGKTNQLFNFTINDTGVANVTEVNITFPLNFVQTNFGTSLTSFTTESSSNYVKWINRTSAGLFDNSSLQYFWVYVTTPSSTGFFNFTVSLTDTNGELNSGNVTISLYDITAPQYSQNITSPPSPTSYSPGEKYWFNISWTDNVAIHKVLLEQNFTTLSSTLQNISLNNESSTYYFNVIDLPAGLYLFKWYANDTNNTFNFTPQFAYNITKALNPMDISFNLTRNTNITITNASNLIINVTAIGPITLYKDRTSVASDSNSISYDTSTSLTSTNLYNFTAVVAESTNYTSNSSTYFVMVVPNYTISYSVPSTYSSTASSFSINFSSYPGIYNLFLELDGTRYAMSNSSLTYYSYSINLAASSHSWKILGNYSNHIFNLTALNSFTIQKASPSLSLTASPGWIVYKGNSTTVSCSSPYVSVSLYRNNSAVDNPDVQTLGVVDYLYICNSTETANYSAQSISKILSVVEAPTYVADLAFTQITDLIIITQNVSNATIVKLKNTGNLTQNVYFWVENINSSWYSINSTNATLKANEEAAFLINFSVGEVEPKNYTGTFKANSTQKSITSPFTLKILPSKSFEEKIIKYLADYEKNYTFLAEGINKTKKEGYNTSLAEQKLSQLKALLDQARKHVEENDYSSAYSLFDNIKTLISETAVEINAAIQGGKIKYPLPSWIIYAAIAIVIAGVCIFLAYLLWPTKEVIMSKVPVSEQRKEGFLEKIKKFLKIKKGYHHGME